MSKKEGKNLPSFYRTQFSPDVGGGAGCFCDLGSSIGEPRLMLGLDDNKDTEAFLLFSGCWSLKDKRKQNMNLGEEVGVDL